MDGRIRRERLSPLALLGDEETAQLAENLQQQARGHGFLIAEVHRWPEGAGCEGVRLADLPGLVKAVSSGRDVWLPYPQDLPEAMQLDILSTALRWRGRRLLVGPNLSEWEPGQQSPEHAALAHSWAELHAIAAAVWSAETATALIDEVMRQVVGAETGTAFTGRWLGRLRSALGGLPRLLSGIRHAAAVAPSAATTRGVRVGAHVEWRVR